MVKTKTNTEKLQERRIRVKYKYINLVTVSAVENGGELPSLHLPPSSSQSRLHLLVLVPPGEVHRETVPGVLQGAFVSTEEGRTRCSESFLLLSDLQDL